VRNIFLHINTSLDGFIEDENKEIDWHFVDDEFEEYINDVLRSIDGMIFGRVAHQLLSQYWPNAASNSDASKRHLEAVRMMNKLPKYVISNGGYRTTWENSYIMEGDIATEIKELKNQPGKDIALFAGAGVAQTFMAFNLIDEYRIVVNPILLGNGTPLFKPNKNRSDLRLLNLKQFKSGATVLCYEPIGKM
jgi:dihydrofolate reductase